jgi:NAD(P)-dependent dehydrogenase (short-subunit alcohol dehydrogenase family)
MTTTLITGANKGLGFETARRLIALGQTVYLGSRLLEMVFGRRFVTGPADSLGRLRRAAEQPPIPSSK